MCFHSIASQGALFRLRDSKGLRYIAQLLRRPGHLIHTVSLPVALGGSADQSDAGMERARTAVTKRIRATVVRIAAHDPALGHHLTTRIKTGSVCIYTPDPTQPIVWAL